MKTHLCLLPLLVVACGESLTSAEPISTEANRVVEIELRSEIRYENPFTEIELDAIVTQPDGKQLRVPGFWAGGDRWCFRYASNQVGKHTWRTECTDKKDATLHGASGGIEVVKYEGDNRLYQHGPIRVSKTSGTLSTSTARRSSGWATHGGRDSASG